MQNQHEIIERYHQADVDHRLSLFLECPALRDRFLQIDQGQSSEPKERREKPKRVNSKGWFAFY